MSHIKGDYTPDERVLLVSGDPGEGKTALLANFVKQLEVEQPTTIVLCVIFTE
jgi:KaiC/GvpD/RAD55 family RecA-like ATPase